jgi:hypothetical protein
MDRGTIYVIGRGTIMVRSMRWIVGRFMCTINVMGRGTIYVIDRGTIM